MSHISYLQINDVRDFLKLQINDGTSSMRYKEPTILATCKWMSHIWYLQVNDVRDFLILQINDGTSFMRYKGPTILATSEIYGAYYSIWGGVATVSRIDKLIGLFCRIASLL